MRDVIYIANKFRLCPISRFDASSFQPNTEIDVSAAMKKACKKLPIQDGLAVECETATGSYIVVAFVYPDEEGYYYKSIGDRIETCCNTEATLRDFRDCITVANLEFNRIKQEA